jgi:hypothetical protein
VVGILLGKTISNYSNYSRQVGSGDLETRMSFQKVTQIPLARKIRAGYYWTSVITSNNQHYLLIKNR